MAATVLLLLRAAEHLHELRSALGREGVVMGGAGLHDLPRGLFDALPGEERTFTMESGKQLWHKAPNSSVTFYTHEPPTAAPVETPAAEFLARRFEVVA